MIAWELQVNILTTKGYTVLRYDRYGSGYSDRHDEQYTIEYYTKQLDELLSYLDIQKPVHINGRSLGGHIALGFASRYPDKCKSLIVTASSIYINKRAGKNIRIPGMTIIPKYLSHVLKKPITDITINKFSPFISEEEQKKFKEILYNQMYICGTEKGRMALFTQSPDVIRREISRFRQVVTEYRPIMFIWGSQDRFVSDTHMETLIQKHHDITFVKIDGAGHGINITHQDRYNTALIDFLADCKYK
jgi:pimeloyl-ACP methyl ester carboxylesterase